MGAWRCGRGGALWSSVASGRGVASGWWAGRALNLLPPPPPLPQGRAVLSSVVRYQPLSDSAPPPGPDRGPPAATITVSVGLGGKHQVWG